MSLFDIFRHSEGPLISPVVLVIFDGWGLAPPSAGNAITQAKTPNMDKFYSLYPHGELIASGESVGLPATEVGNSEVGHLTMGVGRVIYQSLKRINISIEKGDFYENKAIGMAVSNCIKNNSNLHLLGLASSGNVHSSIGHLYAVLQLVKKLKFGRVYLHLFMDGRDAPPDDGIKVLRQVEEKLSLMKTGVIATISGRYYAMDRDARWDRVKAAYDAMVLGRGMEADTAVGALESYYKAGQTDEFIPPTVIKKGYATINDHDSCVFFNFRVDRARELTMALTLPDFELINPREYGFDLDEQNKSTKPQSVFKREKIPVNLFFVTMTEYHKNLPVSSIVFPPEEEFPDSLPEVISKNGLSQFHLAESEKERMVTYYFRGMRGEHFLGETVRIVPSPKVSTYDKKPEMSAPEIVKEFKKALGENKYHLFVMNFANPDMVAHSGKVSATVRAIEAVDKAVGEVVDATLKVDGTIIVTADHGNAEEMLTFQSESFFYTTEKGEPNTDHSSNPVPVVIISNSLQGQSSKLLKGTLADIAPTICAIMNIEAPSVMEGRNLLMQS